MKPPNRIERIAGSSRARILSFIVFAVVIGSFMFLALRADAALAASRAAQIALAQQSAEIRAAGSMNDLFHQGWLANEQNFPELARYADQLIGFTASRTLDPKFRQELNDYIAKNQPQVLKESDQIGKLSFSDGILKQDQTRLLEMYDELNVVLQTMQVILRDWDQDTPLDRNAKMGAFQAEISNASLQFQTTRTSQKRMLDYARQLEQGAQQTSTSEQSRIQANRALFRRSITGLVVSLVVFAAWLIFLVYYRRRKL